MPLALYMDHHWIAQANLIGSYSRRMTIFEAAKRIREGIPFAGVIYAHQLRVAIGVCIRDLEMIAMAGEAEDIINQIQFLPL